MTQNALSAKSRLTAFIRGTLPDLVIVSPIFTETVAQEWSGASWDSSQDSPVIIEAKLAWAEAAGFSPIIKHEIGSLDFFVPREEILLETPEKRQTKQSFDTPLGELSSVVTFCQNSGHADKPWCEDADDVKKMMWVLQNLDYSRLRNKIRRLMDRIGERGLFCVNIGQPLGWFGDAGQLVFLLFDHPQVMQSALEVATQVSRNIIDAAVQEGVICFFAGQLGSNVFSPAMVREWVVPLARALRDHCHARNAIYYLHVCGKMQANLDANLYRQIHPDWLEGFEAPPLGDIGDLRAARQALPDDIVFKGNLNVEFLAKASPSEIEQATVHLLDQVKGYRHIVGGACSVLGKTPVENIRAMVKATRGQSNHKDNQAHP